MSTSPLHEIHPGVYLGDYEQALNLQLLQTWGVTHVLNCASGLTCPHSPVLTYLHICLNDDCTETILPYFSQTNE